MLGWLKRNRSYNVCDCGQQITGNTKACPACATRGRTMAQGWLCRENGHIFMVLTFPTRKDMSKSPVHYEAKECPICLSKDIVKQSTTRK